MVLKLGSEGYEVASWQAFLNQQDLLAGVPDGVFGDHTHLATIQFQAAHALVADGEVGPNTLNAAKDAGFLGIDSFPPTPAFEALDSSADRAALFGKIEFVAAPTEDDPEAIRITNGWKKNLVWVEVPQLVGVSDGEGSKFDGKVRFHKLAAEPLKAMFCDWEAKGLLPRILTFDGGYAPRLQRGSKKILSAHAFGSAIDLNAGWNGLNKVPSPLGAKGSVIELVEIANAHGFYWGGHFSSRHDGMHFELAKLP
jgi:hypothetical protein